MFPATVKKYCTIYHAEYVMTMFPSIAMVGVSYHKNDIIS